MKTDYLNRQISAPMSHEQGRAVEKTGTALFIPHHNGGFELKSVRSDLVAIRKILVNAPTHQISADRITPYVFDGDKLVKMTVEQAEARLADYSEKVGRKLQYAPGVGSGVDVVDVETGLSREVGSGGLNSQVHRWL